MNYFIFTFEIYLDSVYKAGGKVGRITLIKTVPEKKVVEILTGYYTKIFSTSNNLTLKIVKIQEVDNVEYQLESLEFVII